MSKQEAKTCIAIHQVRMDGAIIEPETVFDCPVEHLDHLLSRGAVEVKEDAGGAEKDTRSAAERQEAVNDAVAAMNRDDTTQWTKAGLPLADVVNKLVDFETTAEEREAAHAALGA